MHVLALVLAALVPAAPRAQEPGFPPAPTGYVWVHNSETRSAFLKPDGWFHKQVQSASGTWGYFFSKEDIDGEGGFRSGLSVNIIFDAPQKSGLPAPAYAEAVIAEAVKSHKVLLGPWHRELGPFQQYGVRILVRDADQGDYTSHMLVIGNADTGTVYLMTFEAPTATWEAAWTTAEPMLQKFSIDTEI